MREIEELFATTEIEDIKILLTKIINKMEKLNWQEKDKLAKELVQIAKNVIVKLQKKYKMFENFYIYPEEISITALIAEEIVMRSEVFNDMSKTLKFILNNYLKRFKKPQENDWYITLEDLRQLMQILERECDFFNILKKKDIRLNFMLLPYRINKYDVEFINYDVITNFNFSIRGFYCSKCIYETLEVCLKQFGFLLKEILVGDSQRAPNGFWELFATIEEIRDNLNEESKELTGLFAEAFSHYIIEKMERRITETLGNDWKDKNVFKDELFTDNVVKYFDNLFKELLKNNENEEWDKNELCPCGSGKKYKNCCQKKKIKYYKSKNENEYVKSIPINPILEPILYNEKLKFKKLFGRTPGENDYVQGGILLKDFTRVIKLYKRNDCQNVALLYAYDKTGIIPWKGNIDLLPEVEINKFKSYVKEYNKRMKSKIKNEKVDVIQLAETMNYLLNNVVNEKNDDMIYVLNLFVNFYSNSHKEEKNFQIKDIKDFLVFCAYKASISLKSLEILVSEGYYDSAMAIDRTLFEILISIRTYKNNPELFKEKIMSIVGIEQGKCKKISRNIIENIETKEQYRYVIPKKQLAEKAGKNYVELYDIFYEKASSFIHVDVSNTKNMFSDNDLFEDIDECLISGFIGMIFVLGIIMELMEFDGNNKKFSKDIKYFSNVLLKDFLDIIQGIINMYNEEIYNILKNVLQEYQTDYQINYKRNNNCEVL